MQDKITDPYSILGLSPGATAEEIRKARNSLAKAFHPDKNVGNEVAAEASFVQVQKAFEELTLQGSGGDKTVPPGEDCQPRRYKSPPPRRTRDTSPPSQPSPRTGSTYEPIYEERRPRESSPFREERRPEKARTPEYSFRDPSPPPRRREERRRRRSRSREDIRRRPRSRLSREPCPDCYCVERKPRWSTSPEEPRKATHPHERLRNEPLRSPMSTVKYSCGPSAAPRWEQPRFAPSPHVISGTGPSERVPPYEAVRALSDEAHDLAKSIEEKLSNIIRWLLGTVKLEAKKPRMQFMFDARDDAYTLDAQQKRLNDMAVELRDRGGWSYHANEVLDLHNRLSEMVSMFQTANDTVRALVRKFVVRDGPRFDYKRDWREERRQDLWDGIKRFRSQVKRLPASPRGRRPTTTTYYRVR